MSRCLLWLQQIGCAVGRDAGLAQEVGGVSVLRGGEKYEQEIVEESADLLAHGRVLLRLECVEQRGDYGWPQIRRELALDLALQVLDFAVVEEVERRIEFRRSY